MFTSRVEQRIQQIHGREANPLSVTGYVEAPLAYDAVWALALALDKSQSRYRQSFYPVHIYFIVVSSLCQDCRIGF